MRLSFRKRSGFPLHSATSVIIFQRYFIQKLSAQMLEISPLVDLYYIQHSMDLSDTRNTSFYLQSEQAINEISLLNFQNYIVEQNERFYPFFSVKRKSCGYNDPIRQEQIWREHRKVQIVPNIQDQRLRGACENQDLKIFEERRQYNQNRTKKREIQDLKEGKLREIEDQSKNRARAIQDQQIKRACEKQDIQILLERKRQDYEITKQRNIQYQEIQRKSRKLSKELQESWTKEDQQTRKMRKDQDAQIFWRRWEKHLEIAGVRRIIDFKILQKRIKKDSDTKLERFMEDLEVENMRWKTDLQIGKARYLFLDQQTRHMNFSRRYQ